MPTTTGISRPWTTSGPTCLMRSKSFFAHYAGLNGKQLEVLARKGPRRALKLLKAGAKKFESSR